MESSLIDLHRFAAMSTGKIRHPKEYNVPEILRQVPSTMPASTAKKNSNLVAGSLMDTA